jgi:chromosome partitioning protein
MLAPTAKKRSPLFSAQQLAQIIGLEKSRISYRAVKDKLPPGVLNANGSKREWTLTEVREWARSCRPEKLRQKGKAAAATICIANFKGGVAKTTTAATLAQGLSLRGHKVLIVDTDPQGSLSVLAGVDPTSVEMDETVLPLYQGSETSLQYAVRPSYWAGVDIVASSPIVYDAEFALPARQANDPHFEFWSVLDLGLDPLRDEYDVIIIDTPPSLSYSTINALMASDGLVMPIPPNMLDFASSAQFWRMYLEFAEPIKRLKGVEKLFNFINVLMTRVDNQEAMSSDVRRWIMSAYGDSVLPIEIPKTSTASTASAEFGTAYDLSDAMANSRTWKRAHDAYERFVDLMEEQVIGIWANQTQDSSGAPNAAITKI